MKCKKTNHMLAHKHLTLHLGFCVLFLYMMMINMEWGNTIVLLTGCPHPFELRTKSPFFSLAHTHTHTHTHTWIISGRGALLFPSLTVFQHK